MFFSYKTGFKRLILYGIAVIIGLILLSPIIITWGINTSYIKNKISSFLYQKTGTHIDGSKFSLAIFPNASISVHKVLFNPDNGINLSIDFVKFDFDILQLLQGKININQITIDRPEIKPMVIEGKPFALSINIFVSNYIQDLKKIFTFLPEHQAAVELRFKNAITQYFKQMDGSVYLSKEKEEIRLNTTIKKIKFKPATLSKDTFEKYSDLDSIELDQIKLFANINSKGEIKGECTFVEPKLLSINKDILLAANIIESSFKLCENGYQLVLTPFKLNYPEGTIGAHFENNQIQKKSTLEFIGTQILIDPARQMSLKLFKNNEIVKTIFQIVREGVVPNIVASFHSKDLKDLFNANQLRLTGNFEKGSVKIPGTNLMASDVKADVHIHNGILDIQAKNAIIQNSKIEKGHLSIDLLNHKNVPFQGEFSLDLDLSLIPQTLISLLPETLLARELSLVHDVAGRSKTQLTLLMEPDTNVLKVKIKAPDFSATGYYDRIPGNISLENVNFNYEPDLVSLKHFNASFNDSKINDFNTLINFKNNVWITIQSGSGVIDLSSTIPWLMSYKKTREMISPVKHGKGKIHISSIDLSGPILNPELWEYELKGKSAKINITTQENQKQIQDLSCQYHFTKNLFNMKNIQTKIHHLSWIEHLIEKKHLDSILIPFDLEKGDFQMGTTESFFKTDINFPSGPKVYIDLKGETPASFDLSTIKILDTPITNTSVSFNYNKDKPLFDFKGILNTTTLNKVIRQDSFWAKKIKDLTEGQSILIEADKNANLNVTTKTIDLSSIFSQAQIISPEITTIDKRLLPDKIIHLKADQVKIKNLTLTHIDSLLYLKQDPSHIKLNKAFLCDLETSGYINFNKDSLNADIAFKATNKDNIQDLFACLLKKYEFMDGQYSLTGNLKSNSFKKDFLNTLNGAVILNAEKGRIYKLTLLSRILSVLNVSKIFKGKIPDVTQDGFAYNKISLEADIKDSIIYLNRAIIDGQDMTLIFSGWIDPVNDTLDLTCLVAPFKTIDLIIKNIPILNTLLDGRLVSVPTKATGKLSDPLVVPLHPSAVGEGLVNMMSDILKTPVKLWDKIYVE